MEKERYPAHAQTDQQSRPEDTFMNPNYYDLGESVEDVQKKRYNMKTLVRYMEPESTSQQHQQPRAHKSGRTSSAGFEQFEHIRCLVTSLIRNEESKQEPEDLSLPAIFEEDWARGVTKIREQADRKVTELESAKAEMQRQLGNKTEEFQCFYDQEEEVKKEMEEMEEELQEVLRAEEQEQQRRLQDQRYLESQHKLMVLELQNQRAEQEAEEDSAKLTANASQVDLKGRTSRRRGIDTYGGSGIQPSKDFQQFINPASSAISIGMGAQAHRQLGQPNDSYGLDIRSQHVWHADSNESLMDMAKGKSNQKRVITMPQFQSSLGQDSNRALPQIHTQNQAKLVIGGVINSESRRKETNERFELDSDCNVDLEEADELNSDQGAEQEKHLQGERHQLEQSNSCQEQQQLRIQEYLKNGFNYTEKRPEGEATTNNKPNNPGNFNDLMSQIIGQYANDGMLHLNRSPGLSSQASGAGKATAQAPSDRKQKLITLPPRSRQPASESAEPRKSVQHRYLKQRDESQDQDEDVQYDGGELESGIHAQLRLAQKQTELQLLQHTMETRSSEIQQLGSQIQWAQEIIQFQKGQSALCDSESTKLDDLKSQMLTHHDTLCDRLSNDDAQEKQQETYTQILVKLEDVEAKSNQKVSAWENEIRDLQDKTQLKQFKIDKFEQQVAKMQLERSQALFQLNKQHKEIDLLYQSLKDYGYQAAYGSPTSSQRSDPTQPNSSVYALQALKNVLLENSRLKDELHQVIHAALRNYYDLSRFQHKMLTNDDKVEAEEKINTKIDESMAELKDIQLSSLSLNLPPQSPTAGEKGYSLHNYGEVDEGITAGQHDSPPRLDKNYIARYNEILNEAKSQFLSDLSQFQQELQNSRKLFIQLHKEKIEQKSIIEGLHNQIDVKQNVIENQQHQISQQSKIHQRQKGLVEKVEGELSSSQLQLEKLENIKESKEQQMLKMTEELKYLQAKISKYEQNLFDYQTEIQRKKQSILEQQQHLRENEEEKTSLKERIEKLMVDIGALNQQLENNLQEDLLKDVEAWFSDCLMYSESFLENQELINKLALTCEEQDSSDGDFPGKSSRIHTEEVGSLVQQLVRKAQWFEPARKQLRMSVFNLEKKLHQYKNMFTSQRQRRIRGASTRTSKSGLNLATQASAKSSRNASPLKKSMKKQKSGLALNSEKSHTGFGLDIRRDSLLEAAFHGRSGMVQEIDYATMTQELQLRLDMCQDEKEDLAKELKSQTLKAHKADELKLKNDTLTDNLRQLKSRHLLLVEKVKKHAETNCSTGQELTKVLTKLNTLSKIPLLLTASSNFNNQLLLQDQSFSVGRKTQRALKKEKLLGDSNNFDKKSMLDPRTPTRDDHEAEQLEEETKRLNLLMMSESDLTESHPASEKRNEKKAFVNANSLNHSSVSSYYAREGQDHQAPKTIHEQASSHSKVYELNINKKTDNSNDVQRHISFGVNMANRQSLRAAVDRRDCSAQTDISLFNCAAAGCQTEQVEPDSDDDKYNEVSMLDIAAFMDNQTILIERLADQGHQDRHDGRQSVSQNTIVDLSARDPAIFADSSGQQRRPGSPHQQYNSKHSNQTSSFLAAEGPDMRFGLNDFSQQEKQGLLAISDPAANKNVTILAGSRQLSKTSLRIAARNPSSSQDMSENEKQFREDELQLDQKLISGKNEDAEGKPLFRRRTSEGQADEKSVNTDLSEAAGLAVANVLKASIRNESQKRLSQYEQQFQQIQEQLQAASQFNRQDSSLMNMDYAAAIQELKSNADLDNSNEQANIQELENTLKSQSRHSLKSTLSKKNTLTQIPELEEYETKQGKDSAANERQRSHGDSQIQYPSMTSQHQSQAAQRIDSVSQGSLPSILESELQRAVYGNYSSQLTNPVQLGDGQLKVVQSAKDSASPRSRNSEIITAFPGQQLQEQTGRIAHQELTRRQTLDARKSNSPLALGGKQEEIPELNEDFFQMGSESQEDGQALSEQDFSEANQEQQETLDIYQQKNMIYQMSDVIQEDYEGEALESNLGTARGRLPSSARLSLLQSQMGYSRSQPGLIENRQPGQLPLPHPEPQAQLSARQEAHMERLEEQEELESEDY